MLFLPSSCILVSCSDIIIVSTGHDCRSPFLRLAYVAFHLSIARCWCICNNSSTQRRPRKLKVVHPVWQSNWTWQSSRWSELLTRWICCRTVPSLRAWLVMLLSWTYREIHSTLQDPEGRNKPMSLGPGFSTFQVDIQLLTAPSTSGNTNLFSEFVSWRD